MKIKKRLDAYLVDCYPKQSRAYLQSLIMQGKVSVDDSVVTKSGFNVCDQQVVVVRWPTLSYVSRAGLKMHKALEHFKLNVAGLTALDAGISTGGFSDCLLQHGVKRIYGIDVGYGQLHEKLRTDSRVMLLERTNVRYLTSLPCAEHESEALACVDIISLDLSFISVLKVIPSLKNILKPQGILLVLIKPQFEAQRNQVGKGGIITDSIVHQQVIQTVSQGIIQEGFALQGIITSPIKGADGNKEFLSLFYKL